MEWKGAIKEESERNKGMIISVIVVVKSERMTRDGKWTLECHLMSSGLRNSI